MSPQRRDSSRAQDRTIGERIAWQRRRRGLSQEVLAGLVGRTTDWLSKVENNRIPLDRLSLITVIANVLQIPVASLVDPETKSVTAPQKLLEPIKRMNLAIVSYDPVAGQWLDADASPPPSIKKLSQDVDQLWRACQEANYELSTQLFPDVLANAQMAVHTYKGPETRQASNLLALTYHAAEYSLPKLGDSNLALIAAERGLAEAQKYEDPLILGSLARAVAHSLLSRGDLEPAMTRVLNWGRYLRRNEIEDSRQFWSVYGTLNFVGAMAAARFGDRDAVKMFMNESQISARKVQKDCNDFWTAFGPTNVAIHQVATHMELGDLRVAVDLGPLVNTSSLPVERRVRHSLETARALNRYGQREQAMAMVLSAAQSAPYHARHHFLSRQLTEHWLKTQKGRPPASLVRLVQLLRID